MSQDITTGERGRIKQLLLDFRDGGQDVDDVVDQVLAVVDLVRTEPVTGAARDGGDDA